MMRNTMLLQKVYTTWLQFTLDNFIKKKVLRRFQSYQNQKLTERVFKALRCSKALLETSIIPKLVGPSQSDRKVYEFQHEATFRHSQDNMSMSMSMVESELKAEIDNHKSDLNDHTNHQYVESKSSYRAECQQTPLSGFVESSFGGG